MSALPLDGEGAAHDAARLYAEMWSVERIARLFRTDPETMRRLISRHTALRTPTDDRARDPASRRTR